MDLGTIQRPIDIWFWLGLVLFFVLCIGGMVLANVVKTPLACFVGFATPPFLIALLIIIDNWDLIKKRFTRKPRTKV